MPRYLCDYCDAYLTHDSATGRHQHATGWKHRENFKQYYMAFYPQWVAEKQRQQYLAMQQAGLPPGYTPGMPYPPSALAMAPPPPGSMAFPPPPGQTPQFMVPPGPPGQFPPPGQIAAPGVPAFRPPPGGPPGQFAPPPSFSQPPQFPGQT